MKVIIMNNTPIFIYWNYTEFWSQQGKKDVAGLTVRCFVKKGVGENQVAYKEIVKNIKPPEGWNNEDKAKGRRDTLDTAVKLLFPGVANKEVRRTIWKAYLESQHNNINGTRMNARDIVKEMKSFTVDQLNIVRNAFFNENKKGEEESKVVKMRSAEPLETLQA